MQLYVEKSGSGEPLILLHGLFGSLENLGAIARLLENHFTLYRVDLRNHGQSPHAPSMSFAEMVGDVIATMDKLELPSAHFFGHSLGGKVAMALAFAYPQRVNKLIVADIAPTEYPPHHNDILDALQAVNPNKISSRKEADQQLQPLIAELPVRQFILRSLERQDDGNYRWRMNVDAIVNNYDLLRLAVGENNGQALSYDGDVLFLRGGKSHYILERNHAEIMKKFPRAKIVTIEGASHWLHAEKPDEVAGQVLTFLSAAY